MSVQLITKQQAKLHRYNKWGGNPEGDPYDERYCAEEVWEQDRGAMHHQCGRKKGFGPEGLYCKPHSLKFMDKKDKITKWLTTSVDSVYYAKPRIEKVEVEAASEMFVWIDSRKISRNNDYTGIYHDTWDAAHKYLIDRGRFLEKRVKEDLKTITSFNEKLKTMKENK